MKDVDFLIDSIYTRYGYVRRAREMFLYTQKGRLTDLYREGGRAILGWGGNSAFTMLKDVLSRGATGSYKTQERSRIQKAVSDFLQCPCKVYAFNNKQSALEAALNVAPQSTSVYKAWNISDIDKKNIQAFVLEPPLAWTSDIYIVAFNDSIENELRLSKVEANFNTCYISSPISVAICRSFYNLTKAINELEEKDFFIYDTILTKYWYRKGPYLYPKPDVINKDLYKDFMLHCLSCSVVISPIYDIPSIVPFGADRGVFRALEKNPFKTSV